MRFISASIVWSSTAICCAYLFINDKAACAALLGVMGIIALAVVLLIPDET